MGSLPQWSPLDTAGTLMGGAAGAATGNPALWLTGLLRPAARAAILSRPYQSLMTAPSYGPGLLTRSLGSPALSGTGGAIGAGGLLQFGQ